jgi:DNA processing protein
MSTISLQDSRYPFLLRESKGPPEKLYYDGQISITSAECISVIGSRAISTYGETVLNILIPSLVKAGLCIVSGLAYGVDSFAHTLALKYDGLCCAVLGSGLKSVYPRSNIPLLRTILAKGGCVLSEYEDDVGPQAYHFPQRNRIVAALSKVLLIIEAGEKSGTLITARFALEAGRDVCVVPADITRKESVGVHYLLKQGARPVTCAEDILELYGGLPHLVSPGILRPALTGSMATLYDLISQGQSTIDQLHVSSALTLSEIHSILSVLELDDYIYCKGSTWLKTY